MSDYKIEQYDSPNRFLVQKSEDCSYLVEIGPDGNECSCPVFQFNREARICKHVVLVQDWILEQSRRDRGSSN